MEGCPKFGSEECIPIGDKVEHQTIFAIPFVEEHDSDLGSGVCGVGSSDANVGLEWVNYGQDGVFPMFLREWPNEI